MFIPSTLNGSNTDNSGKINETRLKENISDAIEVYISRVDGTSCGDTSIRLQKGANSHEYQMFNHHVKIFFSGTKRDKEKFKLEHPDVYCKIKSIWDVWNRHLNKDFPSRYIFHLVCCYQPSCPHPFCQQGKPDTELLRYTGGPPVTFTPLPVQDKEHPHGSKNCVTCGEECAGYHMKAEQVVDYFQNGRYQNLEKRPPSEIVKVEFQKEGEKLLEEGHCERIAKAVLLKVSEVNMWSNHLKLVQEHRREGAKRAAITRSKNTTKQNQGNAATKTLTTNKKSKELNLRMFRVS